jgi:hypothetical protein
MRPFSLLTQLTFTIIANIPVVRFSHAQAVGGYTNPYSGAQPWSTEPIPQYIGVGNGYTITRFSSVRITGVTLDDQVSNTMGVYLPYDNNGDGVVDTLDGRPIYRQRDIRTTQTSLNEEQTGVRIDHFFLYYKYSLGGWAIHSQIGSEQAILYCTTDVAMAHELHNLRNWKRVEGDGFVPDRRIQLLDLSHEEISSIITTFSPPEARMDMLIDGSQKTIQKEANIEPSGHLCPQGHFRDEHTATCHKCPRGRFGDSNDLTSGDMCQECPAGKYLDIIGGKTIIDCMNCTAGKYSSQPGASECGGSCPIGKFSNYNGAYDNSWCIPCPKGYRSEQCDRKDNSKQMKRQRERDKRNRIKRSRQDAARTQSRTSECSATV